MFVMVMLGSLFLGIEAWGQDCTKGQNVTFAQLPVTTVAGTTCKVTDVTVPCTPGTVITVGGGSTTCTLVWNSANWIVQNVLSGGGGGGGNVPPLQYTINNLGSTTTPNCDFSLGYICTWNQGASNATLTVANIPTNAFVTIIASGSGNASGQVTLPATMLVATSQANSQGLNFTLSSTFFIGQKTGGGNGLYAFTFWCDGTNCWNENGAGVARAGNTAIGQLTAYSLNINGDTAMTHAPRGDMYFKDFSTTLPATTTLIDCSSLDQGATVTKITLSVDQFACTTNPTILVEDCGGTVNSCATPATIGTAAPTAVGASNVSITGANITAGHYICANISAGACTLLDWGYKVTYKGT